MKRPKLASEKAFIIRSLSGVRIFPCHALIFLPFVGESLLYLLPIRAFLSIWKVLSKYLNAVRSC